MSEIPTTEIIPTTRERITGEGARRARIESLPGKGFNEKQRHWINDKLVKTALPVENINSLHRRPNKLGREDWLGSWLPWHGEFSIYELLEKQVEEKKLGTVAHESGHANTPFDKENTFIFGSENAREAAAKHAIAVAEQTLITEKFINGYHNYLHGKLSTGEIDRERFNEETWAIMTEMALTNRAGLEQKQEAQHRELERRKDAPEKVYLMSHEENGEMIVDGIDVAMINLIDGVENLEDLKKHVIDMKGEFYSDDNYQQVQDRRRLEEKKKKEEEEKRKAKLATELARLDEIANSLKQK
jgi:hypothetical protein